MNDNINNIHQIRREYASHALSRCHLTNEPIQLLKTWINEALQAKITDPTAMCLATVDHLGNPHQRLVLLKQIDKKKLVFYTNLNSNKAKQIKCNPRVSICFPWHTLNRQVIILGYASQLPKKRIKKYFYTRPKYSQISTWASFQSKKITSKKIINKKFFDLQKKFKNLKIPVPKFWGGYQIYFDTIEFWQGRKYRLHDRFIYQKILGKWYIDRLSP